MFRRIFTNGRAKRVKREGNLMQFADSITFIFTRRDVWLTETTWKDQRGWGKSQNLRTRAFSKNQSQHVGHFWLVGKVLEPPGTSTGVVKCRASFSRTWREVKMVQRRDKTCTFDRRAFWSRRSTVIFKERERDSPALHLPNDSFTWIYSVLLPAPDTEKPSSVRN